MSSCEIRPPRAPTTPNSIHVPLFQNETGDGEFSTWPQAVQNLHLRELARWAERHPDMVITERTSSIDPVRRITITEFLEAPAPPPVTAGD